METVGQRIRRIREEKGLGLRELGRRADISHSYLSQIENGNKKEPKSYILRALAHELDVDYNELLDIAGYNAEWNYLEEAVIEKIKKVILLFTDEEGYFYPRLRESVFEAIKANLYMAPAFHNSSDAANYESQFTAYFSNPDDAETYLEREHLEMEEDFNKAYNIRTIIEVLESSSTNLDELNNFLTTLEETRKKYDIEPSEINTTEQDLHTVINEPNVTYKKIALTDKDKDIITAYLDGIFSNRE